MTVEIRETIVTPTANGSIVQLHISDAPLDDESAQIVLRLTLTMPKYEVPVLMQIEREAIKMASSHLDGILHEMAQQLQAAGETLNPWPAGEPGRRRR